ncbi:hypothetical protein C7C46_09610 [Streptomyces tateyamensis]|uniref:Uncharacterized protein n=1 Tax=Streptomyces tateyamensis TaxID=565073 RepID=A0A2V4NZK1_9ACTN|nr:hypothetical protein [Streptomyces tateyamensis]PYC82609.1 hypothetical protein C7C46_09610 [Streptomyces tateyamensis]
MHLHLATTDHRPATVRADLAVHLAGHHEAHAVLIARTILLTMPSVRVRLAHPQPSYEAYKAWTSLADRADRVFAGTGCGTVPEPEGAVSGNLRLDRPVPPAVVETLPAKLSPTRAPQLRVSVGGLLTVVTDKAAFASQLNLWTTAYRHAARRWDNLPSVEELAAGSLPRFDDIAAPVLAKAAA